MSAISPISALSPASAKLSPLELTFRDYVLSLAERRNMDSYRQAQTYWRERIPTLSPGPRMPVLSENAVGVPVSKPMDGQLSPEKWTRLKDYGTRIGLSPTSILLAAFSEVLRRWNSEKNFCLNLTLFNRLPLHPQIDEVVGDFTDTLLLEVCDDPEATFEATGPTLPRRFPLLRQCAHPRPEICLGMKIQNKLVFL